MTTDTQRRTLFYGSVFTAGAMALGLTLWTLPYDAIAQDAMVEAPIFEVDPLWPKPLPNEGLFGMIIGASVDADDTLWFVPRGSSTLNNNEKGAELTPPTSACCRSAPPVVAFNPAGEVIRSWGG